MNLFITQKFQGSLPWVLIVGDAATLQHKCCFETMNELYLWPITKAATEITLY